MATLSRLTQLLQAVLLVLLVLLVHVQPGLPSPVSYLPGPIGHIPSPYLPPAYGAGLQMYRPMPGKKGNYDWKESGSDFPNPLTNNPDKCNSGVTTNGFACDPDKNLKKDDVTGLSHQIEEIITKTKCQCPKNACSAGFPMGKFSIGIAVATNITGSSDKITKLRTFSKNLRESRWKGMKRCNDLLVIALEVSSRTIYMSPDSRVSYKITDKCARNILEKTQKYFKEEDYYTGFSEILQYVKNALRGGECGQKPGELSAGAIVGIVFGVIIGVALIVGLIACCVGFCQGWECIINTCIGIVIGMILGCIQAFINALVFSCVRATCDALGLDQCCKCEPLDCVSGEDGGGGVGAGLEY